MDIEVIKQYLRDNLRVDSRTERPMYGMGGHVTVILTLEGEQISETYLEIPKED